MIMNWDGDGRALPLVDILTISATGSEYDPMGVISNLQEQEKIGSVFCYPSVSICDPTYTFSVSAYQTAAGAGGQLAAMRHRAALTMARRTAVPVGQVLGDDEMEQMLSDLLRCPMPNITPTGETILTILREDEVRKRF